CGAAAGSALLGDEALVARIFEAVVAAVSVPVTVKIRTGPDPTRRNAPRIASLAQACGLAAVTVHGRTRACAFRGRAELRTVTEVKATVAIPVIANGDIDSPRQAALVLRTTGVDAVMIGRAAQGNPWIFAQTEQYLRTGMLSPGPTPMAVRRILLEHLDALYAHYGDAQGVRVARKHIGWYCRARPGAERFWQDVNRV
ncbi:MAG: tRNA-dihydrouridine synthase, partial [Candidatus Accumulibacter sp.]|nr:tRNA-dihydrouridine synthase [Accumulibacter sp.]